MVLFFIFLRVVVVLQRDVIIFVLVDEVSDYIWLSEEHIFLFVETNSARKCTFYLFLHNIVKKDFKKYIRPTDELLFPFSLAIKKI